MLTNREQLELLLDKMEQVLELTTGLPYESYLQRNVLVAKFEVERQLLLVSGPKR